MATLVLALCSCSESAVPQPSPAQLPPSTGASASPTTVAQTTAISTTSAQTKTAVADKKGVPAVKKAAPAPSTETTKEQRRIISTETIL